MSQTQALMSLEPYITLAEYANSPSAAVGLVTRATSDSHTFVFAELLQTNPIKNLATSEKAAYHALLKIFSYGTYQDYLADRANLPDLNDAQRLKLRQLSLLTLAQDQNNLTYAKLMAALELETTLDLESIVISAVYAGLWDAVLNPQRQVVEVNSVSPLRDLAPGIIPPILDVLQQWCDRCATTLGDIDAEIAEINMMAAKRQEYEEYREATKDHVRVYTQAYVQAQTSKMDQDELVMGRELPHHLGSSATSNIRIRQAKRAQAASDDMDLDTNDEEEQKKRTSRRKL
ncbi:COP9 signalosome subunit 7 (CsnG) [Ceratocystis lukuohia]|uniref:COP9 signalosome subunit 7 (CsnG) n=1 Tax=Ceratocystis lukuohia TaxID=2019550 RepID=A0ABR4MC66_9PEZI